MTGNNLAIIVLAAGQGTRMKSRLPKVLHPIGGRPLVGHVLTTAARLGADHVEVVVRHERDQVVAALADKHPDVVFVDQDDVPGTWAAPCRSPSRRCLTTSPATCSCSPATARWPTPRPSAPSSTSTARSELPPR